ncbi:hypothetical protein EIN_327650 [Entamoeba invadens IP1]|uniref:Uncharacterized protein n=1 Tax=Entamoeba invadens IP1 TaxID=370355 RepID=A0A0A1U0N2_ENTIV|nr:hypothetical protein EIN_327650 [Entamoeba invadens IP1]ELP86108.1 hypothetical protein EIN_327650 [Entamoeba invadens IP1]|eukprot:XP_004185454.1 hypothetical protein EIN_327650 [Entamoeba invadens IP1]
MKRSMNTEKRSNSPQFDDLTDLPDFLFDSTTPSYGKYALPASVVPFQVQQKKEPFDGYSSTFHPNYYNDDFINEPHEINEHCTKRECDGVKDEIKDDVDIAIKEELPPLTPADECEYTILDILQDDKNRNFRDTIWRFNKAVLEIKTKRAEIIKVDFHNLSESVVKLLENLFEFCIRSESSTTEAGLKDIADFLQGATAISDIPIFSAEQRTQIDDVIGKIAVLLPAPSRDDTIEGQKELREYLSANGINTTAILIQLCDPKDSVDFLKGVDALLTIFTVSKHTKANYSQMIKALNSMDSGDGTYFATPYFLLVKAFNNCVIKQHYKELVLVLSQAIRFDLFTPEQNKDVNEMLNVASNRAKSSPERLGKRCTLKHDPVAMSYGYVVEYLQHVNETKQN